LRQSETCNRRPWALLLVLLCHSVLIEVMLREGKPVRLAKAASFNALMVFFLPSEAPHPVDNPHPEIQTRSVRKSNPLPRKTPAEVLPVVPEARSRGIAPADTDWQHELELTAQNNVMATEKGLAYRDLSKSLSPSQLDWLKQNHMEPSGHPGIKWKEPRVEVTKDGLPIVHLNDHCVLIPLFLIPMVFCSIGHIEPDGDLLKPMRDPRP
jgi:hypothetical protein